MDAETFSKWVTDRELAHQSHLAIFNDGKEDYLVCRYDFMLPPNLEKPEVAALISRIATSTIVSPAASQEDIDRISKTETK